MVSDQVSKKRKVLLERLKRSPGEALDFITLACEMWPNGSLPVYWRQTINACVRHLRREGHLITGVLAEKRPGQRGQPPLIGFCLDADAKAA